MTMPKDKQKHQQKEQFQAYRRLPAQELWARAQTIYPGASDETRQQEVALIRAVGVVIGDGVDDALKADARSWLVGLLRDPLETVRRYAITALPRLNTGQAEEKALLSLLESTSSEREKAAVVDALQKIGGDSTLRAIGDASIDGKPLIQQKITARQARETTGSRIRVDHVCRSATAVRVALRCREGMEQILEREVQASPELLAKFPRVSVAPGVVVLGGNRPFRLDDLYALRCFDTVNFPLGKLATRKSNQPNASLLETEEDFDAAAEAVASPASLAYFEHFTEGPWRYRIHDDSRKRQSREVSQLAERVHAREPRLLNDTRQAPWTVHLRSDRKGARIELCPHAAADRRFAYRQGDVPAASHPPLAAALAYLARPKPSSVIWDPFCGSGTELIECAQRAAMEHNGAAFSGIAIGTDLAQEALTAAADNWRQAGLAPEQTAFHLSDFRQWRELPALSLRSVDCIVSNPPMGRRVPVGDLRVLMDELFVAAAELLKPGGCLVIANPVQMRTPEAFRRSFRAQVDMGGFSAWIERHTLR